MFKDVCSGPVSAKTILSHKIRNRLLARCGFPRIVRNGEFCVYAYPGKCICVRCFTFWLPVSSVCIEVSEDGIRNDV